MEGISRLSQTVASRDEEIQTLLASSRSVSEVLADRSEDIVQLMDRSDLVFQELQQAQGGDPPAAGQRPDPGRRAARPGRGQPGADRARPARGQRPAGPADLQGEGAQGHPGGRRPLRLDPRQHHRHRPVVRRLRLQPGRHPDRRVPARPPRNGRVTAHARPGSTDARSRCAAAVLLLTATFFTFRGGEETRTVTAHFPRAVSVYKGTDVRVLGVNVGRVTAVTPEGNSVRVEMEYDAKYQLPSDAKAVIVTPTLVADRFVQLTPAYDGKRRGDGRRRRHRAAGDGRPGRARPDLRQPARPVRGARPQRRQQGRHPRPPAPGVGEGARRAGRARQRDAPQPVGRHARPSATAARTCSPPSPSWPSSPRCSGRTTASSARSSATWPACRRRWSASGSSSSAP